MNGTLSLTLLHENIRVIYAVGKKKVQTATFTVQISIWKPSSFFASSIKADDGNDKSAFSF